jgi:hypothetical protein
MKSKERRRRQILKEMAQIDCMEKGRLTAEYRQSVREGKAVELGPYYKHQRWENGRNLSRRVPAGEAQRLRKAVESYHRFQTLASEYAELTIDMTRQAAATQRSKKKPRS